MTPTTGTLRISRSLEIAREEEVLHATTIIFAFSARSNPLISILYRSIVALL
jgi:hypothetical protein